MELIPMNKIWQFTGFLCKEMDILKIQPHKSVSSCFPWYFTAKDKYKVIWITIYGIKVFVFLGILIKITVFCVILKVIITWIPD